MLRILGVLAVVSLSQGHYPDPSRLAPVNYGDCRIFEMIGGRIVDSEMGICVSLPDCPRFAGLTTREPNGDERTELQLRNCGYYHDTPLVCCSIPPDGPGESLLPEPGVCGTSLITRIVGGTETKLHEHRWMALLLYIYKDGTRDFFCGGSFISKRYVLTAAHCIPGDSWRKNWNLTQVRLGEWNLREVKDCEGAICANDAIDVPVEKIIPHESYDSNSISKTHDIALLRLESMVPYSEWITPICLPRLPEVRTALSIGRKMEVVGWGRTEEGKASHVKMKTTLAVHDFEDCRETYSWGKIVLGDGQMCARGEKVVDVCAGDSGGPLVDHSSTAAGIPYFFVTGVVSMGGAHCGLDEIPAVFTRVGAYLDWIESKVQP